jgi:hypothetical protein
MPSAKLGQCYCPNTYDKILPRIQGGMTAKSGHRRFFQGLPPGCGTGVKTFPSGSIAGNQVDRLSLQTMAPLLFCRPRQALQGKPARGGSAGEEDTHELCQ